MWRCANCDESVEDTFDICWNCGVTRDGAIPAEFEREPDDPAVPDPGEDSHDEQDRPELDSAPLTSGGMNRREIAILICKTIALILFAIGAVLSVTVASLWIAMVLATLDGSSGGSPSFFTLFIVAVPVVAIVGVGIVYWTKSEAIASLMVSADPRPVAIQPFTVQDAMTVAFSTAGIFLLLGGIRDVVGVIYLVQEYSLAGSEFWFGPQTWTAIIQLMFALWLILGSRGIVAVIHWCRSARVPRHNDETQGPNDQ